MQKSLTTSANPLCVAPPVTVTSLFRLSPYHRRCHHDPLTTVAALPSLVLYLHFSVSTESQPSVHQSLFADYKPSILFLFPGQGAQAVGMGKEAQNVPAAALLFSKANDILGFDLLDICINGPKEKLDSTVISQNKGK
ncbi:Acyl transferase/acyl hydrolase/lysophospholipase [Vigna unguiculata]|uniref:Acyl transferase/acyl hydrolase/lysophospholipase n=1 Tax=Vigna unguiculata TaxID=3917 RepID=A0A4D6LC13_VIGUN|nr:Acyl transferase/acyl hydrolase/lysophospholipase [Vigna unguiculata]